MFHAPGVMAATVAVKRHRLAIDAGVLGEDVSRDSWPPGSPTCEEWLECY